MIYCELDPANAALFAPALRQLTQLTYLEINPVGPEARFFCLL
jgi:hypothetical protein